MSNDTVSPERKLTVTIVNELISRFYRTAMDIDQVDIVHNCHDELIRHDNSHSDLPYHIRRQVEGGLWNVEDLKSVNEELISYLKNFDAAFNKEWEEELGSFMKELMHEYIYRIADSLRYIVQTELEDAQGE